MKERGSQLSTEQKGKLQRPIDGPPSGAAKRFDPFAGQDGNPDEEPLKATERVRVPMEDKKSPAVWVPKKYDLNKKEAKAKIPISDAELKKPESELSKEKTTSS